MDQYLPQFKTCLQKEPPFCVSACPFRLDVEDFVEKLGRGAADAAYKTYRNAVGFPKIVSALCPAYCKEVCPLDHSIELRGLEEACLRYAKKTDPPDYNLPLKKPKVAIVGMGISGMGCLLRLATKKYQVTAYEKTDRIGGQLWNLLDSNLFLGDFHKQLQHETYEIEFQREIQSLEELVEFDAIYIDTGLGGKDFGLLLDEEEYPCFQIGNTGVFAGGSLLGKSIMESLADGLQMGTTIDNFLKTKILQHTLPRRATTMVLDPSRLENQLPYQPFTKDGFTLEEAIWESNRCIKCQCDACRIYCDLTEYYNRWPLRIRDEIAATTLPGSSEVKSTPAKRLINTCTQCGLCKETCPKEIDLGGLILSARKNMHKQDKLPWAFHEFWIRDMLFSNGDQAFLCRNAPGSKDGKSVYAFFPGCQLGASDPSLVTQSYQYLLQHEPATGIILSCCGVPAEWGGDEEATDRAVQQIRDGWISLSKPTLVMTCPTCKKFFQTHLSEIPLVFLYDLMANWGVDGTSLNKSLTSKNIKEQIGPMSIFDPCSTYHGDSVRRSIRKIVDALGIQTQPLPRQEAFSACCSYGGQVSLANPDFTKKIIHKRIEEGPLPYIAYCINCRDAFLGEGKPTYHLLDLLFDRVPALNTISQRRENRIQLKQTLLRDIWEEEMETNTLETTYGFHLEIDEALRQKLGEAKILEEDMMSVIEFCQRTGRKIWNPDNQSFSGYLVIGHGTYWAEYAPTDKGYRLINGYCHRIHIELEGVWNGRKVETDL